MLCAHPMVPGYMQRAIVLILEHSSKGSYGLIINKTTDHTVETSTLNLPTELMKVFSQNTVSFGGNIPRTQILHPFPHCGGKMIPGCSSLSPLYDFAHGSIEKAIEIGSEGPETAKRFQFVVGCCVWKAGMLEQEIKDGTWIVVGGEVDQILAHARQEPVPDSYSVLRRSRRTGASTVPSFAPEVEHGIYEGPNETWSRVLWSLSRQTNHFAHLDPSLESSSVESIDWHYSDEGDDEDDEEDDDESESGDE
jgi:putative AlgH/UPF0301 family transcriptional regulator